MKLNRKQINALKKAHAEAIKAEAAASRALGQLSALITKTTGVEGFVDHFPDDGFGFTTQSNDDTHIGVYELICFAEKGVDIDEDFINRNATF